MQPASYTAPWASVKPSPEAARHHSAVLAGGSSAVKFRALAMARCPCAGAAEVARPILLAARPAGPRSWALGRTSLHRCRRGCRRRRLLSGCRLLGGERKSHGR